MQSSTTELPNSPPRRPSWLRLTSAISLTILASLLVAKRLDWAVRVDGFMLVKEMKLKE